jgi:chemotaxis protein methyltransferase CheR
LGLSTLSLKKLGLAKEVDVHSKKSSTAAFAKICELTRKRTGVQLNSRHHSMVESRLFKRWEELGLKSLEEYADYLTAHPEEEKTLVSQLTTHHTYFFRESAHFELLSDKFLGDLVQKIKASGRSELRIWSAACSRGHEVYSLAMWILPWLEKNAPGMNLKILGTDVDPESVSIGANGVYGRSELAEAPIHLVADHWAKGTGDIVDYVRAKKKLRSVAEFRTENLFQLSASSEKFDIIFCRNVFIYFTTEQIKEISESLLKRLEPHGLYFIGISESLTGMTLPVDSAGPSVFRHKAAVKPKETVVPQAPLAQKGVFVPKVVGPSPQKSGPIRVLCVDDSKTILTLLKKILVPAYGFEVVGTCENGAELAARLKQGGVDVVTLDIHMPVMTGIEYLKQHMVPGHVPVVMITSVSRENSELALSALQSGAADYVEKPALADLEERAEEIRFKLKMAFEYRDAKHSLKLEQQLAKVMKKPDSDATARLVSFAIRDRARVAEFLRSLPKNGPPTLLFVEGGGGALPSLAKDLSTIAGSPVSLGEGELGPGRIILLDWRSQGEVWRKKWEGKKVSVLFFSVPSPAVARWASGLSPAQVLIDDHPASERSVSTLGRQHQIHRLPFTSFLYQSEEYLASWSKAEAA